MNYLRIAEATGLSIIALVIIFLPMEKVFPAKKDQKFFRPHWVLDMCFLLGQYFVWGALVLWALTFFSEWLDGIVPKNFRASVVSQPYWLQAIEVILLSDFLIYWAHRLQHKVGFLWRFHKVHHSSEHLDWLAAHREHPLDTIYTVGIINLPAFILGFPLETLSGFIAFRGIWAIYIHSNVRLSIGPLRWFIGAPELHHWHHDKSRDAGNYANISPLMDIIFGTYTCPAHEPESFGIHEPTPKNYIGQLVHPIVPYKLKETKSSEEKIVEQNEVGFITKENLNIKPVSHE
ncbi:MAG: Fatty acid hydroxylase superfamily protein [Bacteroidetes bacterium]|jgi:sterol desaturase/sphingolipid hydroxylase (fatty acid hydroxylase superfamily)|nr:Fatty acid hydroxylase superfamily protein [Bacteroidota bacterium]